MRNILFSLLAIILLNPTTGFATDFTSTSIEITETDNTGVYVGKVPVYGGGSLPITLVIGGNRAYSKFNLYGQEQTEFYIVSGNYLMDKSGWVKVGIINGDTVTLAFMNSTIKLTKTK